MKMNENYEMQFGSLNTTLRVREMSLLKPEDYERLLAADDYDEALNLLMNTPYREGVSQARESHDYQTMVMDELKETYHWIKREIPDDLLYRALTLKYVYHNVKVLFKERLNGALYPDALIDIGPFPIYALRQAVNEGQGDKFKDFFLSNLENMRNYFDDIDHYQQLDVFIDRAYVHHLKRLSEEMENPKVAKYFDQMIDETNILIFFRALRLGHSPRELAAILTDEGDLKAADFVTIGSKGEGQAARYFSENTNYRHLFADAVSENGQLSIRRLEQAIDHSQLKTLDQAKFEVFGPLPVIRFVQKKELEVDQLRLILAGKLNNIDTEVIRERMRG
ncbi:V-type ATPase subunit [Aerococcaceae bacterium DSM 111022]|nr:V-type ATPase subunit [Aerococcaceae bacterium DSM 111022]